MKHFQLTNAQTGSLCAALAYLLEAGLSIGDALHVLSQDEQNVRLKGILQTMAAGGDAGKPLYVLMGESACFPAHACRLMEVGEQVGKTVQTLTGLARYYKERSAMAERVRRSILYPAALLLVLLGVIAALLIWVMPIFQEVYAGLGSGLSGFALWLLTFGKGLGWALPFILICLAALAIALAIPAVRRLVKRPFSDRGALADIHTAQYLQALSLGIGCGMPAKEASQLASRLAGQESPRFLSRCQSCTALLEQEMGLPQALAQEGFVGAMDKRLLEAGLRSGHGDEALETIAKESTARSEGRLENTLSRIEPVLVAIACGIVAGILLSVMVPLLDIMNALG